MAAPAGFAAEDEMLATEKGRISYALGRDIAMRLKSMEFELDVDAVAAGIRGILNGNSKMTNEQMGAALTSLQNQLRAKAQAKTSTQGGANVTEGKAFLETNAKKEGVTVLASGLQYEVVKAGTGASPAATDTVTVHYSGKLLSGKEFDSSYSRGQPAQFPVNGVIKGWTEALQLMKVGAKWKLYIPSDLAYGARGAGRDIGPNATLVFDVELIGIKGK